MNNGLPTKNAKAELFQFFVSLWNCVRSGRGRFIWSLQKL